jgi:putative nucleotidyltransferase with HDIG domain
MRARKILITQAIPGMIAADDVYTRDHHLVIAKDTVLTDRIITRLRFYSITELLILSDSDFIEPETKYIESTYYDELRSSEAFQRFHTAYLNTVNNYRATLNHIASHQDEIDTAHLLAEVNKLLHQCSSNIDVFHMLHCIRHYDDTTYLHSLNVALICNIMGKWLHFSPEELKVITLSGLLHDIGKLMIPSSILAKPARLTEEEFTTVKTHTIRGYNILKNRRIDKRIKQAALLHHERCDGSGYPYGFRGDQIDPYAKLVAIADVYDAMTCARVYRGPLCPFEVVSIFESEGLTKYEPQYIMTFLEGVVQTYINNHVRLSNQQIGEIIMINKTALSKPVVKVGDQYIDLSRTPDLSIEALL